MRRQHRSRLHGPRALAGEVFDRQRRRAIYSSNLYTYTGGIFDQHGRGFLGFESRTISGPGTKLEAIQYQPLTDSTTSHVLHIDNRQRAYPWAFIPTRMDTEYDSWTSDTTYPKHYVGTTIASVLVTPLSGGAYQVTPNSTSKGLIDCDGYGAGACTGTTRSLGLTKTTSTYDTYGNLKDHTENVYDKDNTTLLETTDDSWTYEDPVTSNWLVRRPKQHQITSSPANQASVTRTTAYTSDDSTAVPQTSLIGTGEVKTIETEPYGDKTVIHAKETIHLDPRGRLQQIDDVASPDAAPPPTSRARLSLATKTATGSISRPSAIRVTFTAIIRFATPVSVSCSRKTIRTVLRRVIPTTRLADYSPIKVRTALRSP